MTPLDDYYGRDERITYLARHVMREAIHMPFAPPIVDVVRTTEYGTRYKIRMTLHTRLCGPLTLRISAW